MIIAKLQKLPPLPPARLDLGSGRYSAPETWKRPSSGHARRYSAPKTCLGRRVQAATLTPKPGQPTLHQESRQVGVLRVQGTVSNHRGLTLHTDACCAPFSSSVSFITHTASNHRGLTLHTDACWAPFSSSVSFITHTASSHRGLTLHSDACWASVWRGLTRHAPVDRCQV